jgi:cytochrome P450
MFAGMDTTSSAVARIIWLLATHQDVQDKLRAEIREAKRTYEEPDYDQLSGLPYLDAVCRESLRLYALLFSLVANFL